MRMKRAVVGIVIALVVSLAAVTAALATGGRAQRSGINSALPPVRIAFIGISIPGLNLLDAGVLGAQSAAAAINKQGGFGGRKVEIISCNSMFNPSNATDCARTTLSQGVVAEIGCDPAWTAGGLSLYGKAGIPSFNCTNATADLTYRWSFGLFAGATGIYKAEARWLCTRSDVHHVVVLGQDYPAGRQTIQDATQSVYAGCGKQVDYVFAPLAPADFTPYIQQVLALKPDFVQAQASPAPSVLMYKAFQQAGWPPTKLINGSQVSSYVDDLGPAGSAMEGTYIAESWHSWGDSSNPEVAAYTKAVQAYSSSTDYRNSNIVQGYSEVNYIYAAAKKIGFTNLTPQKLAQFSRSVTNFHWPMSDKLMNPGPKGAPQVKNPDVFIVQWTGGKMVPQTSSISKDGWYNGW
jgi:branched-chain amino acid transport system substrate-binding protein